MKPSDAAHDTEHDAVEEPPPPRGILELIIAASVKNRLFVLIGTVVFAGVGLYAFSTMRFDAFPDLTNIQVQVLTATPGLGTREVEALVTTPVERVMGGLPGLREVRSLSRNGVSAVTVVFADGTDRWHARQLVRERLDAARAAIPEGAGMPEIAPPTTGLGEVFQLAIASDRHEMPALYRLFERDIAPRLRTVDGVVEVNAWGGGAPQIEVKVDPFALAARRLPLARVEEAIGQALGLSPGGAVSSGAEQTQVRAVAYPASPEALGELPIADGVRLSDVAALGEGGALTVGLGTHSGRGEALFVMVQLLADADARATVAAVRERLAEIAPTLAEGITLIPVYDREKLVSATLATVARSLVEGGLLVIVILFLLLGDLRAGLVVASVIPLSLLGAFLGLRIFGLSGNLMSLGAIDFGLIVDGTIVVVESLVALGAVGAASDRRSFADRVIERAQRVARPVFFAVAILALVYVPILMLWGTEGKLFRPMALTVLFALGTALMLTFTFIPALSSLVIKPRGAHETPLMRWLARGYRPLLAAAVRRPLAASGLSALAIGGAVLLALGLGVEFVPRLEEGDLVVQTRRLPSLNPETALREATRVERAIALTPEVIAVATRTGSPAVATDPMGLEEADVLVHLAPRDRWREGFGREAIVAEIEQNLQRHAPGAELNFTQPIEMRFSELLEGITADVGIQIFGPDLDVLLALGAQVATRLERIDGAADVVAPTVEGTPQLDVEIDAAVVGRYGLAPEDVLGLVAGVQRGTVVGQVPRGGFLDDVVVRLILPAGVPLAELPVVLPARTAASVPPVPLGELATLRELEAPAVVQRLEGSRRVVVTSNVRGRDVGGFVAEARLALADLTLPKGYRLAWRGKFEQLAVATERMLLLVPAVLFVIIGVLYLVFRSWRGVALIFLNIPVAVSGGLLALTIAGLPLSMSALVGCIALFGVAVMNGVVLITRLRELDQRLGAREAALIGARERFRPVLTTAAVAGIGFVPMAIAQGVGAEVQRPLAIVVIGGLVTATLLTLVVLPSLYARIFASRPSE